MTIIAKILHSVGWVDAGNPTIIKFWVLLHTNRENIYFFFKTSPTLPIFSSKRECQITDLSVDVVGVDLGVKTLATLSTGEVFDTAKAYKKLESKLSRLQYLNRHKTKFSNNWKKTQLKIAQLDNTIANTEFKK